MQLKSSVLMQPASSVQHPSWSERSVYSLNVLRAYGALAPQGPVPTPDANAQITILVFIFPSVFRTLTNAQESLCLRHTRRHQFLSFWAFSTSSYSFSFLLTRSSARLLTASLSSRTSTCRTSHSSSSSGSSRVVIWLCTIFSFM